MLDLHEITELENKWEIYNRNKNKNISKNILMAVLLVIMFILFFIFLLLYFYNLGASNLEASIRTSNEQVKKMVNDKKVELEKKKILEKKLLEKENIQTDKKTNDVKVVNDSKKDQIALTVQNIDTKKYNPTNTVINNTTNQTNKIIKNVPKQVKVETIVINDISEPMIEENISEEKVDNLDYLIIKYNETKSIYFALDIAQAYYDKKDYQNARKWALIANKQDSNNEKSWIMFAKSSYKLGLKEQAINSLNNYLNGSDSVEIKKVLMSIKQDKL